MYNSVKDIGKKEKKKSFDEPKVEDGEKPAIVVNAIAGSNKKRKRAESEEEVHSEDTDDMSTDSEIDEEGIQKALQNAQNAANSLKEKTMNESINKLEAGRAQRNKGLESEDEETPKEVKSFRKTKYVHVDRRKEIQVI